MTRGNFSINPLLLILAIMVSFSLWAEESSSVKNLSLQQISVEDGLSQATVSSILASESGLVWLATENGLNYYDGYSIKQLPGPDNRFIDTSVYSVKQDKDGWLWINASDGLYRFQPKTNQYQLVYESNLERYVADVVVGKDNTGKEGTWIATGKKIVFY